MSRKAQVIAIYSVVIVLSVAMLIYFRGVGARAPEADLPIVSDAGRTEVETMFPIEKDIDLTNQEGEAVKLSDIKGEVTLIAEFFAVCPHCAVRNGKELVEIYKQFGSHPDFRIVCISVDPETDKVAQLKSYGDSLKADPKNWWFVRGENEEEVHDYLENTLKFFQIKKWRNPVDIASNGRYSHDMGFLLVNREFEVIGKWPLVDARSDQAVERDPGLYGKLKLEMYDRIRKELEKK
ncbi:SCO family protein [Haloferula chungangensis]|uniref:SCO family protein n=1 Tax=Haloferula chungangensis TaxID=1048331 RepID=A0ABW2L6C8_9BACT